jgi:chromosome segregation ATPase
MMAYERVPNSEIHELQTSWEMLRKQARNLEQQIDSRLILLSQGIQEQSAGSLSSTQQEITGLLSQLTSCTQDMQVHVDQNASLTHLHSRHVANLYEYNREFNKTRVLVWSL